MDSSDSFRFYYGRGLILLKEIWESFLALSPCIHSSLGAHSKGMRFSKADIEDLVRREFAYDHWMPNISALLVGESKAKLAMLVGSHDKDEAFLIDKSRIVLPTGYLKDLDVKDMRLNDIHMLLNLRIPLTLILLVLLE